MKPGSRFGMSHTVQQPPKLDCPDEARAVHYLTKFRGCERLAGLLTIRDRG